jgi:bacterial/archaeal transporter family-2 protein
VPKLPYILIAILLGGMITLQPGLNADVARRIGSPFAAAFISTAIAFLLTLAFVLVTRQQVGWSSLTSLPWHLWLAGGIGFVFVVVALWLAPILGASLLFGALIAGQMIVSMFADRFGIGGYHVQTIDAWRIAGLGFVLVGVWMFQRSV